VRRSIDGRHLRLWSASEAEQTGWQAVGADGDLNADDLVVSVSNHGADKLDFFLDVGTNLQIDHHADRVDVSLQVELRNDVPNGLPDYVVRSTKPSYGQYFGILAVNLPGAAFDVGFEGVGPPSSPLTPVEREGVILDRAPGRLLVDAPDGPTRVAALSVMVDQGATVTETLRFSLPPADAARLRIIPSGRQPSIAWLQPAGSDDRPFLAMASSPETTTPAR
jgi:hypothetical protein